MDTNLHSMLKPKSQIIHFLISQELLNWTKVTINNLGVLPISMTSGFTAKMIIYCVVMFLTSSVTEKYLHTNTSKYGLWDYTSSMDVLQERSLMLDHIVVISWDMHLLQELFYTRIQNIICLYIEPIMFGLMNIILASPYNKIIIQVIYYFNNTLRVFFTIWNSSTWSNVNLILYPIHSVIQQFSHMKLSYLLMERRLILIY